MIYLNGQFISPDHATIETTDRGFLLSDGIFETIPIYHGKPFALEKHWLRLKKSADLLELPIEFSYEDLVKNIETLCKLNAIGGGKATLRLTVTRGSGPRGLNYPDNMKPTIMMAIFPTQEHTTPPANLGISTIRRNEYSPLANIKSLAYLDNILARREMVKRGFSEAILLNTQGNVASCSAANIFIVTKDNRLITPHIKDGVLPGITREIVLVLAAERHITIEERSIHPDELFTAKEVLITNSVIEIQAVKQIHDKIFNCDENYLTRTLQAAYNASITECMTEQTHLSSCKR